MTGHNGDSFIDTHRANILQNIISVVWNSCTWWGKKKIRGVYTTTAHWNLKISTNATTATLQSTSENSMLDKFQNWMEPDKNLYLVTSITGKKKLCQSLRMTHLKIGVSTLISFQTPLPISMHAHARTHTHTRTCVCTHSQIN